MIVPLSYVYNITGNFSGTVPIWTELVMVWPPFISGREGRQVQIAAPVVLAARCTVFLQRGSCIYSEKSYGMSYGSYYKISIILRWVELEFSKMNVFRAFQDPVTFGGFVLYLASLPNKIKHIWIYFHFVENAEVLMLKKSCILGEYNLFQALKPLRLPQIGYISQ